MITLRLGEDEQEVLRRLATSLLHALDVDADNPALRRLFPPAYAGEADDELETEYRRLMGGDLQDRRRAALQAMLATLGADKLDETQAGAWVIGLNELRLVLGTRLDVHEDDEGPSNPSDPRFYEFALYHHLSALQASLIDQLAP